MSVRFRACCTALIAGAIALGAVSASAGDGEPAPQPASWAELKKRARQPVGDPATALSLGQELRRAGLHSEALLVLRRVYGKATRGPIAAKVRYAAARVLLEQGKPKAGLHECKRLRPVAPAKYHACTAEAYLQWRRGSAALPAAERALSAAPNDYDGLVARARALSLRGKPKESERDFRAAIAADSSRWEAHRHLAALLLKEGKPKRALRALRAAAKAAPDEPEVLLALAEELPAGQEARTLAARAAAIRPDSGAAHALYGRLLLDEGKLAEAKTALERAVGLDGKQADWQVALGRVHLAKGDDVGALARARAALALVGNHAGGKLLEADCLAERGDIDLAIEAYEAAWGFARTDPRVLVRAARASLAGRRPTTARAFAERATSEFEKYGPAWEIYGDVSAAEGNAARARSAYRKALKAPEGKVDAAAIRKKLAAL